MSVFLEIHRGRGAGGKTWPGSFFGRAPVAHAGLKGLKSAGNIFGDEIRGVIHKAGNVGIGGQVHGRIRLEISKGAAGAAHFSPTN